MEKYEHYITQVWYIWLSAEDIEEVLEPDAEEKYMTVSALYSVALDLYQGWASEHQGESDGLITANDLHQMACTVDCDRTEHELHDHDMPWLGYNLSAIAQNLGVHYRIDQLDDL